MSFTLPTVEAVERHYWAVLIRDEFRPHGEEFPVEHKTKEEAEKHVQRFVDKRLATLYPRIRREGVMTGNEAYSYDKTRHVLGMFCRVLRVVPLRVTEGIKARAKHGDAPIATNMELLSVLMEEVGEVATALNQNLGEKEFRKELVQVASVAIRYLAGDLTFSRKP